MYFLFYLLIRFIQFISRTLDNNHYATMDYKEYLRSERWYTKREQRKRLDNYTCQRCGSRYNLQVHHRTYKRRGFEAMEDLETLCKQCHRKEHGLS